MVGEAPLSLAVLKTELPLVSPTPDTLEAWIELALDSSPEIAAARRRSPIKWPRVKWIKAEVGIYPRG